VHSEYIFYSNVQKNMKKLFFALFLAFSASICASKPWKLHLKEPKMKIELKIDLYEESIEVPDMEMFGPMNGYLGGDIYGVWTITSFSIKKNKAILRLSNDLGSETQEAELTQSSDTTYTLKLLGNTVVKKIEGRKLVKIAPTLNMIRK
jgi:hypothetical protein